jgi:4-hydroxy-tetrahydrodipicolinate synthase
MVPDNFKFLQEFGGDGTIGGGSIYGKPDPKFWEDYWNKNYSPALDHATANEVLLSKLWQPGGWRGIYGAYQSQLKAIMKMIGVDAGTVRPPRLPITDQEALKKIRTILIECNISVS